MHAKTLFKSARHSQTAISTTIAFTTILPHAADNHPACFRHTPDFISIQQLPSSSPFQPSSITQKRRFDSKATPASYVSPLQTALPHLGNIISPCPWTPLVPTCTQAQYHYKRSLFTKVQVYAHRSIKFFSQQVPHCYPANHPHPSRVFEQQIL